jgi:hypothetical protein
MINPLLVSPKALLSESLKIKTEGAYDIGGYALRKGFKKFNSHKRAADAGFSLSREDIPENFLLYTGRQVNALLDLDGDLLEVNDLDANVEVISSPGKSDIDWAVTTRRAIR